MLEAPRKAVKVTVDGNEYYVRSLIKSDLRAIDEASDADRLSVILMAGVCDVQGNAIIASIDELDNVPLNVMNTLSDEIQANSKSLKKRD